MTVSEQARRIVKAAPHLPLQAWTSVSILCFGIPMIMVQMVDSVLTRWVETKATIADHRGIQERTRNGELEYFYSIGYGFDANGQKFIVPFEKGFPDRSLAESALQTKLSASDPVILWYDQSDPSHATFEEESAMWAVCLGLLVMSIFLLAYFRWLLLKYYELELAKEIARR